MVKYILPVLFFVQVVVGQNWYSPAINQSGQMGPNATNMFRANLTNGVNIVFTYGTNGEISIAATLAGGAASMADITNVVISFVTPNATNVTVASLDSLTNNLSSVSNWCNSISNLVGTFSTANSNLSYSIGTDSTNFTLNASNALFSLFGGGGATLTQVTNVVESFVGVNATNVDFAASNFHTNWANAISNLTYALALANSNLSYAIGTASTNYAISVTNSASVTNWINSRQVASPSLTNIDTTTTFLTNWANAISNLSYTLSTAASNLSYAIGTASTNYAISVTNSASVTNWITTRQPASASLTNQITQETFLTNWANAISNYVTAATNSASVTNWITTRQPASASLTNQVTQETFLTNWCNAVSNLSYTLATAASNLSYAIGTAATNYAISVTNSASVTNWINSRQLASTALTNLSGNPNVATQILAGANITIASNNAGVYTITGTGGAASTNLAVVASGYGLFGGITVTNTTSGSNSYWSGPMQISLPASHPSQSILTLTGNTNSFLELEMQNSNAVGSVGLTLNADAATLNAGGYSISNYAGLYINNSGGGDSPYTNKYDVCLYLNASNATLHLGSLDTNGLVSIEAGTGMGATPFATVVISNQAMFVTGSITATLGGTNWLGATTISNGTMMVSNGNFILSGDRNGNIIQQSAVNKTNIFLGGMWYYETAVHTNFPSATTYTNLAFVTVPGNMLTNTGDTLRGEWGGNFLLGTNRFLIGYGSITNILDTGAITNNISGVAPWTAKMTVMRTGLTSEHVEAQFYSGVALTNGAALTQFTWSGTNINVELAETNGINNVFRMHCLVVKGAGGVTNNSFRCYYEPAPH